MTITFIGAVSGYGTSLTLPSRLPGDLMVAAMYRPTVAPPVPTGWASIGYTVGGGASMTLISRTVGDGEGDTLEFATSIVSVLVYRSLNYLNASMTSTAAAFVGVGGTVSYPAVYPESIGMAIGFAGISSEASDIEVAPAGMVNRASAQSGGLEIVAHESTSQTVFGGASYTLTTASGSALYRALTTKLVETGSIGGGVAAVHPLGGA
jgi:hypothetical protein